MGVLSMAEAMADHLNAKSLDPALTAALAISGKSRKPLTFNAAVAKKARLVARRQPFDRGKDHPPICPREECGKTFELAERFNI